MLLVPTLLVEVMSSTSAIAPRCRSSGVATLLAMTSGLAPGIDAETKIAGASIFGSGATGSKVEGHGAGERHAERQQGRGHRARDERRRQVHARRRSRIRVASRSKYR